MKQKHDTHFGRWLKREIENTGATQMELAHRAGVSFGALRGWLTEPAPRIRGHNVAKLARALGRTREEIEAKLEEAGAETCAAA